MKTSSSGRIRKIVGKLADNQCPATFRRSWNFDQHAVSMLPFYWCMFMTHLRFSTSSIDVLGWQWGWGIVGYIYTRVEYNDNWMPQAQVKPEETCKKMINWKLAKWKVCRVFVCVCVWWLKPEMRDYKNILNRISTNAYRTSRYMTVLTLKSIACLKESTPWCMSPK